jgi:hypothetical protein
VVNAQPPPDAGFPGKEPTETVVRVWREHGIRLIVPLVSAAGWTLLTIASWTLPFQDPPLDEPARHLIAVLLSAIFLYFHFRLAARVYKHFLRAIILTDKKIHYVQKTLLTRDDARAIELPILLNVRKHQRGFLQNMLGYGTLILETPETSLSIHHVPRVAEALSLLMQKRDEAATSPMEVLEEVKRVAEQVKPEKQG